MKAKMMATGGMSKKGYAVGGAAMPMVEKAGKKVPAFAADGVGKMAKGGMMKSKMMASGGVAMKAKMKASGGAMPKAKKK